MPSTRQCSARAAAELSLEEISELVDDPLEAHGGWVPGRAPGRGLNLPVAPIRLRGVPRLA